jgi:hypothetical protein
MVGWFDGIIAGLFEGIIAGLRGTIIVLDGRAGAKVNRAPGETAKLYGCP